MAENKIPVDIEFVLKNMNFQSEAAKMKQGIKGVTNTASQEAKKVRNIFQTLLPVASITAVTISLKRVITDVYRFSNEFSKAMREVQTLSKAVQSDLKSISNEIINIAANAPDDAIQLAQAYYQIVSAGYDGAEGLNLLKVASQSATAGITQTKVAADGLTTILNAWGKEASEAEKVADVMFKTVEKGKTTFPELAANISQVAPLAASMKISFEEVSAAIATLTKQGVTTPMAVTQIRQAIISANEVLGDGWTKAMSFQEALQRIRDMAGGSDTKLREMMGRVEGMSAVLALTGEKAKEASSDLDAMVKSTGAMNSAYGKMMEEADNQWSMVHNKWQRELKGLGDTIRTESTGLAKFLNAMMSNSSDAFEILSKDLSEFTNRWAAMQALRDESLGGWTDTWFGKLAGTLTGLDFDEWRALFASEEKLREWLENSKAVREELKKQEESQKRTDTASIIMEISDIDRKLEKEKELLRFYENKGVYDPEMQQIQNRIEGYEYEKSVWEELLEKKRNSWNREDDGSGSEDKVSSTFKSMQEELKKLHEEILDADDEQRKILAERIIELERELALREKIAEEAIKAVRNYEPPPKISSITKANIDSSKPPLLDTKQLANLSAWYEKIAEQYEEYSKQFDKEQLQEFGSSLLDTGYLFSDVAHQVGQVNKELGEAVYMAGQMATNIGNLITGLTEKDPFQAVSGGVGIITGFISMISGFNNDVKKVVEEVKDVMYLIDSITKAKSLMTQDEYQKYTEFQLDNLQKKISKEMDRYDPLGIEGLYGTTKITLVLEWYKKISEMQGGLTEAQQEMLDQFIEWSSEYNRFLEGQYENILGFSSLDITSSIAEGIFEGLKLGESGLGDFAESFGQLMENYGKKALEQFLNDKFLTDFYAKAYELASDEDGLTKEDRDELARVYRKMIEGAQGFYESIRDVVAVDASRPEGLTGAIKGITEETAGMIAGNLMGIRYDMKSILSAIEINNEDTVQRQLAYMAEVAANTRHNAKLNDIDDRLREMNLYLKNI